jgi:FHA domain
MAGNKPSISLTITLKDGATRVLEFNTLDPIMVGSGASAHVRLEGDDVSSLHCMIKPVDGGVAVLDLGSDDGTELNGKELKGETKMSDGDSIAVGRARITVHFGGDVLAPTVPIRRAAGHEVATNEVTVPRADVTDITAENPDVPAKAAPPPVPGKSVKAEAPKKHDATEVVRDRSKTAKPAGGAPVRTATSMPPRVVQREQSTSGFRLGKGARTAWRSMKETGSHAGKLDVELSQEEKPNNKGHVDVTATWGGTVIGVSRVNGSGIVTIGNAATNDFQLTDASIPSPSYTLVTLGANGALVSLASGMEASIDGRTVSGNLTLEMGQKCIVRVGPVELVVQYSKRYTPVDLGLFQTLDFFYSKVFGLALIAQVGFILALLLTPDLPSLDDDDLFKNQQDFTKLILTAQEKKKEKKELSGKKAAQHKDDAGVFGKKDKPKEDKLASKKGAPTVDKDKREEDRKIAMDALAQLGLKGPEGAVSNVFGPGGLGSGINNQLGGLKGASMGDAGGAGGLGSRGTGAGGGGTGLGIGGLGSGTGRGSGGSGNIDLGGRGKGMTRIVPGKIIYEGGLSREEIQRVISRVMSQIKYCYEKELNKDPNLEGKLVASWVISGSGDVASAQMAQNTFGGGSAQPVEQCVLRIIQRLKFPNPKGGGQVFVTYPFVFSSSGG